MTIKGRCHLCDEVRDLQESHVWPKFAYKDYAADRDKGGQFVRLDQGKLDNHQVVYHWFCVACEGRLGWAEAYAAELCRNICKNPSAPVPYDNRLFLFITSVSWRSAKAHVERKGGAVPSVFAPAMRKWKDVLRGDKQQVAPFTQHAFAVCHPQYERHMMLGGNIFLQQRLVVSQIGPLHIVGMLEREDVSAATRKVRNRSLIQKDGGILQPITEWKVDVNDLGDDQIIRMDWLQFLWAFEQKLVERVVQIGPNLKARPRRAGLK